MPQYKEKIGLKHGVDIIVRRKDGTIKEERHYGDIKDGVKRKIRDGFFTRLIKKLSGKAIDSDMVMNAGRAAVAGLILKDVSVNDFDWLAIGTGTNAPVATQTTLQTETHRVAGTGTRVMTAVANDTAQLVATFSGFSGTEAVTEIGMFNAAAAGDMAMRQTFSVLNVDWDKGDSIEATVKIQVT